MKDDAAASAWRVLVLAPTGRDAPLIAEALAREDLHGEICPNLEACCAALSSGAGALLVADEALGEAAMAELVAQLRDQPAWSELPVLVLTRGAPYSLAALRALGLASGAVTLLERPLRVALLASAVRVALRARSRQYQLRELLAERTESARRIARSEARFRFALGAARAGAWEWDLATDELGWSPEMFDLLGLDPAKEPTLALWESRLDPRDRGRIRAAIANALSGASPEYSATFRVRYPGGRRWLLGRGSVDRDDGGRPVRLSGIVVDVTERQRAAEEIRASEERLRQAARVAGFGVFDLDDRNRRAVWSPEFRAMHGWAAGDEPPDLEGWLERVHAEDRAALRLEIARARGTDSDDGFALEYRVDRGGELRWINARGRLLFEDEGAARRLVRTLGAAVDVTERRRAEEMLRRADAHKNAFLATLAHELRNPLAPMRNAVEILRLAAHDPDRVEQAVAMMDRQLRHLVRLVDDLLDVSRISRGVLRVQLEPLDLGAVIDGAVDLSRPVIDEGRHALAISKPSDPVRVRGDATRLAQAVSNLLNNAARYTPAGGRIELTLAREGGEALIRVADTGTGIPAEGLARVFEMFSRLDDGHASHKGLGVGLALVRSIMELHGGRVEAASAGVGEGAVFTLRLPLASEAVPAAAREPQPYRGRRGLRILIADDDADVADSLASLLELRGHEVRRARDGESALAAAESFRPQLILIDIGMPGLNGWEATRRLRARPWGGSVYVATVSGWGEQADRRRSRAAGCDAHLVKPLEPGMLDAVLKRVARRLEKE